MPYELDAPADDVVAMKLTMAALDRWFANVPAAERQIRLVLEEVSAELPGDDEEEDDDEDDDDDDEEVIASARH